ncbi:MAK10-like protein [Tanacetum coccineum]
MGDENPICTLGDYSKPSHEGYRNTIELPVGNNMVPLRSDTIWLVQNGCLFHGLRRTIDQSAGGKLHDLNAEESWALLEDLALYDNESWNDPRDFAKPVKAISLPQDVPSTSDHRLIKLENQVQRLMEAYLAPTQHTQVNKITTSCEICSGPHDTQYCIENPEQGFVEYASSRTDEAGGKWYTFKPEQNNLGDTYNLSWKIHPNLRSRQPQNSQNNFSNPPNRFQPNGSIPNRSFNKHPQNFKNQSNIEGLVSEFMTSQDARLSKFEANFKQQQSEMTNKIDTVLKAITDRIAGTLPSDTVKNPKLGTIPVLSARSYPTEDSQCSTHIHSSITAITIHPKQPEESQDNEPDVGQEEKGNLGNINPNPHSQPDPLASIAAEKDDGEVMFIEIIRDDDEPQNESPNEGEGTTTEGSAVEYFDTFPARDELTYHKKLNPRENANGGISNFTRRIKGMHVFIGNFTYVVDFMIVEDISSIIDPRLSQVVLGRPFIKISNMTHDLPEGVVRFTNEDDEVSYKMPYKIEQYNSLSNLEKEHTKSVYLRNEEDKRRGVDYVMSKILGFYKECLELGPEYVTGLEDEGEVTLYLMRRSLEVLRKFHWMILGG